MSKLDSLVGLGAVVQLIRNRDILWSVFVMDLYGYPSNGVENFPERTFKFTQKTSMALGYWSNLFA